MTGLTARAWPRPAGESDLAAPRRPPAPKAVAPDAGRPLVMDGGIFRELLWRERQRAGRGDTGFVLALIAANRRVSRNPMWHRSVASALASVTRESDVLGWIDRRELGLLVRSVDGVEAAGPALERRVRDALAGRVDAAVLGGLSLKFLVRCRPDYGPKAAGASFDEDAGSDRTLRGVAKRVLDIVGSLSLLALFLPLCLVIAALIKLTSPGPVLFRQSRVGRLAKPFTMFKFRTMYANVDQALHREFVTRFIAGGSDLPGSDEGIFKLVQDPRITPLGRVLRRTSLDELPQFWNVLRGEMSLVGPRPPLFYELDQYQPWHWRRVMEAKPGITGLWQVEGRSRTTFDGMVRLDLRYAKNPSLWTDVKILLATPIAAISGKGAC